MVVDTKQLMAFWFFYPITFQTFFCDFQSHKCSCLFWVDLRWIFAQISRRNPCWRRWCLMLRCRWFAVEMWMLNSKPPARWMHQVLYISSKGRFSCAWFLTEIGNQWKHVYVCNEGVKTFATLPICFFHHIFFDQPSLEVSEVHILLNLNLVVYLCVWLVGWLVG